MMRCFWITLLQAPLSWAFIALFAGVGVVGLREFVPPAWHHRALLVVAAAGFSVAVVCCGVLSEPG
jgi:hypothetical protein